MGQLTVDSSKTLQARIKADPAFAEALLREATDMFLNGEAEASRTDQLKIRITKER